MTRRCTVCDHPQRAEVDAALVARGPIRKIAQDFEVSYNALYRHAQEHLPTKICVDCGLAKPRAAFSKNMWRRWIKHPVCLACVRERLTWLEKWHAVKRVEVEERLKLAQAFYAAKDVERVEYLARVPEKIRRRGQAQHANGRLKRLIVSRDGFRCGICGQFVHPDEMSIDHIIPVVLGGSDHLSNLQVAHRVGNSRKGARLGA